NRGIGKRRGLPSRQSPVVSSVTISPSLPGGEPARRGAVIGQPGTGLAGWKKTGAPASHFERSDSPFSPRGVWQSLQAATPSTIYLPRAMRFALLAFFDC